MDLYSMHSIVWPLLLALVLLHASVVPFCCQVVFYCMDIPQFLIHLCVGGHLGCFKFLAIVINAAVNVPVFAWACIFISLGYIPGNGVAGSHGSSVVNIFRNRQTDF